MFFNVVLPQLELYAPIAVIAFALLLIVFAEVAGKLRVRHGRSPRMVWIEIIALALAVALIVTLIDWLIKR